MTKRTMIATAVFVAGACAAGWFAFGGRADSGSPRITLGKTASADPRFVQTSPIAETPASANLTDAVAKQFGAEILRMNKQGQGADAKVATPGEDALAKMIEEAIKQPIPVSLFAKEDLRVVQATSTEAARAYVAAVEKAVGAEISERPEYYEALAYFATNENRQTYADESAKVSGQIAEMLGVAVPAPLADFHLAYVNFLQTKLAYTQNILVAHDDPARAKSAVDRLGGLVSTEGVSLFEKFSALKNSSRI